MITSTAQSFFEKYTGKKRDAQTRYLSQAIQLEEAVNPHIIRATMSMVSLSILAFIVWAALTNINEIARTSGEVVPQGHQLTVQHLEGGIIKSIHIHEGDVVEAGQTLLTLDEASIISDLERANSRNLYLDMQIERLRAFTENRSPDFDQFEAATPQMRSDQIAFFEGMKSARDKESEIIRKQIEERKQSLTALDSSISTAQENLKITEDIYKRRVELNRKGYASDMQMLQDKKQVNAIRGELESLQNQKLQSQTEMNEYEQRLKSLTAQHLDQAHEKLDAVLAEKAENTEIIRKLEERIGRMNITASSRGLVKGLAVNTVGAVIQPGQVLMEIVPLDKTLEIQVKISPQDIGHIRIGQDVQVKFSTYDFSRYGVVMGTLEHISASTFTGNQGERFYQGRITINQNHVGKDHHNLILPGMTVMADIITGEKTILQYLLKPIHLSMKTAFTER